MQLLIPIILGITLGLFLGILELILSRQLFSSRALGFIPTIISLLIMGLSVFLLDQMLIFENEERRLSLLIFGLSSLLSWHYTILIITKAMR